MTNDVEGYLRSLLSQIQCAHTVLLCGGYGRGEGAYLTRDDNTTPVNDVDLVIVPHENQERHTLKNALLRAHETFGVPVEGQWLPKRYLENAPFTMFNYDLKFGSLVLSGDANIVDSMPNYDAGGMPLWEGIALLFNRIAGLISGFPRVLESLPDSIGDKRSYQANQVCKALVACGDLFVIINRQYHCNYRERGRRFELLDPAELSATEKEQISFAYRYKLDPRLDDQDRLMALWPETIIPLTGRTLAEGMRRYLGSDSGDTATLLEEYLTRETSASLYRFGQNIKWFIEARLPLTPRFWANPRAIVRVEVMNVLLAFYNPRREMRVWRESSMLLERRRHLAFGWWHAVTH